VTLSLWFREVEKLQQLELLREVLVLLELLQLELLHVVRQPLHLHDEYVRRFLFPVQRRG
jgi:hypothetical protein